METKTRRSTNTGIILNEVRGTSRPIPLACFSILICFILLCIPVKTYSQDDALLQIEQHAETLAELIEKYANAEIDIIKTEKARVVDTQGRPQDCDVAIFYNNGNQPRFTTRGGTFEGNFDHGRSVPTKPLSIRLSNCPCTPVSTTHNASWIEIEEVIAEIEDNIRDLEQNEIKEILDKKLVSTFVNLGFAASAANGFLTGFRIGAHLGQPIGDYLTDSINQILDLARESNVAIAEDFGFAPLRPNVGRLSARGRLGNFFGTDPQLINNWNVVVQCGTRNIPPSEATWHRVKEPIRTPSPPEAHPPDLTDEDLREIEEEKRERERREREEQRRREQEQRERELREQQERREAQRRYEEEQRRLQEKAREIMRTCPICDPIREKLETLNERIGEKEQEIPAFENALADAEQQAEDAENKARDASQELHDFRNPPDWIEGEGRRTTTTDLIVQRQLSRENWQRYINGEQTAQETMDNWENQRDPEIHEAAKQRAEEMLEQELENAEQEAERAKENRAEAEQKLNEANHELDQLNNLKDELEKLLEECLEKCREHADDIARDRITSYEALLDVPTIILPEPEEPVTETRPEEEPDTVPEREDEPEEEPETGETPEPEPEEIAETQPETEQTFIPRSNPWNNLKAGAKFDFATRGSFEDAACDQDGLIGCDVSGLSPMGRAFIEMPLFDFVTGQANIPITGGLGFTRSRVNTTRNFAYGAFAPFPYQVNGQTNITTVDAYLSFGNLASFFADPGYYLYAMIGWAYIRNAGSFDLIPEDRMMGEGTSFDRLHQGTGFTGGLGIDIPIGRGWGARINADYLGASGADNSFRFGGGVIWQRGGF